MKKRFAKIICAMMVVSLLLCVFVACNYEDNYVSASIEKDSVSFFDCIVLKEDDETTLYIDGFGGYYVDENGLGVALFVDMDYIADNIREIANRDLISFQKCQYSLNSLNIIKGEVEKLMCENLLIYVVGVDVKNNCVFIKMDKDGNRDEIVDRLACFGIDVASAIRFETSDILEDVSFDEDYQEFLHIYPEDRIRLQNGSAYATICGLAIDNLTGQIGVLTTQHLFSSSTNASYDGRYDTPSAPEMPFLGAVSRSQRSGSVDAAFVPFDDQSSWGISTKTQYMGNETSYSLGNNSQIQAGNEVFTRGTTTSQLQGEIMFADLSIRSNSSSNIITHVFAFSNAVDNGDSGGPVYCIINNKTYLVGLIMCKPSSSDDIIGGYACRISNVINALDVTILTDETLQTSNVGTNLCSVNNFNVAIHGTLTLPKFINEREIVSVGYSAFDYQRYLDHIYLPDSIENIEANAFYNCENLQTVECNGSFHVKHIGNAAFYNCTNLTSIPNCFELITLGANAYQNCSSIRIVYLGQDLLDIGNSAFEDCYNITTVTIPRTLLRIGTNAFKNCTSLLLVTFESDCQLVSIENAAFFNCNSIDSLILPTNMVSLGYDAFSGCTSITDITLPLSLEIICSNAFDNCQNLTFYVAQQTIPIGWMSNWNRLLRPVVLGCGLDVSRGFVHSIFKGSTSPINNIGTINNPTRRGYTFGGWYVNSDFSGTRYDDIASAPNGMLYAKWNAPSCVTAGSLITLADGSQVHVESLTGNEQLLVWNMLTGAFDAAPIVFIDSEPYQNYEIVRLLFADGTTVDVIDEHAFFDMNLQKYVYLDNTAEQYIGHFFNKQTVDSLGNMIWTSVELVGVEIVNEYTSAWSPVTYTHLCYYVNGMLTMPGGIEGMFNIFSVDASLMRYDTNLMSADIAEYGLFTYQEFAQIFDIPEEVFYAMNGQYLKIAISKGNITVERIQQLYERYRHLFN